MCSLHLTHPSAHTLGALGSRHCGARGAVGGSVPCSRVSPQSWTIPTGAEIRLRVNVMDWPSMSPDLNPIEYLWGIIKRKVEERKVSNIHQLCDVIMEEWKRTSVATCEALVNFMPKRVEAVL